MIEGSGTRRCVFLAQLGMPLTYRKSSFSSDKYLKRGAWSKQMFRAGAAHYYGFGEHQPSVISTCLIKPHFKRHQRTIGCYKLVV